MPHVRVDVFAWIPQAEVPNPIYSLPGGVGKWGPGASGPYFGGDNFVTPPLDLAGWAGKTYRATQSVEFDIGIVGDPPTGIKGGGVVPGTTTVLSDTRANGGRVTYALPAKVKTSQFKVEWSSWNEWYAINMHGEAQDPVPSAVGGQTWMGGVGSAAASALTPNLEWNLEIRLQKGSDIPLTSRGRYNINDWSKLDISSTLGAPTPPTTGGIAHGLIRCRRFPSYVVYLAVGGSVTPIYFADASSRSLAAITVNWQEPLRQIPW